MAVDKGRENPAERFYHLLIVISGLSGAVPRPLVAAQPPQPVSFQPPCTCSPLNFKQAPKWVGTGVTMVPGPCLAIREENSRGTKGRVGEALVTLRNQRSGKEPGT